MHADGVVWVGLIERRARYRIVGAAVWSPYPVPFAPGGRVPPSPPGAKLSALQPIRSPDFGSRLLLAFCSSSRAEIHDDKPG